MWILFLSLVFIVANVEGQNRAFPPFNQFKVDAVYAPVGQYGSPRYLPNLGNQRKFPLFNQPHNSLQLPTFATGRNSIFSTSENIVQQSKAIAESAKALFKSLENIKQVPELFDHVFGTSGCLGNLEDAIKLIDEFNRLISQNDQEIINLEALVDNLMNEKNVTKLISSSAKILRILEDLIPKLTAKSSKICSSSPTDSAEGFNSLAHLLNDILSHRDIDLPEEQRQFIELSSKIMVDVAHFLVTLNKSLDTFENLCNNGMNKDVAVNKSIGGIMESLGALFEVLGLEEKSKDIKKQGDFLKKILDAFRDSDELNSSLECSANGAYGNLALTLDDLAEIVQSVGIEALSKKLGIDLDFIKRSFSLSLQPHNSLQQPSFATGRNSIFSTSGNIVQQSKALAESAKSLFKSLENIKLVPELFDHVFETSGCLGNLEDAIELIDESNKLISKNGPEVIYIEAIVDNLMNEKNVTKLIRSSAKMLRILEDLIPKLTAKSSKICISSPTDSVEDFKSLAHLLRDVLNHRDINIPEEQRQLIELSSKIMTDVAKFLVTFTKSLDTFEALCNDGMTKDVAVYSSIGDIMESLAALFDVLGLEEKSNDIQQQGDFLKKIVDAFRDTNELNSSLECGVNGAYGNLSLTLDDLAEIVHNVGIEALAKELGIDLDFIDEN